MLQTKARDDRVEVSHAAPGSTGTATGPGTEIKTGKMIAGARTTDPAHPDHGATTGAALVGESAAGHGFGIAEMIGETGADRGREQTGVIIVVMTAVMTHATIDVIPGEMGVVMTDTMNAGTAADLGLELTIAREAVQGPELIGKMIGGSEAVPESEMVAAIHPVFERSDVTGLARA